MRCDRTRCLRRAGYGRGVRDQLTERVRRDGAPDASAGELGGDGEGSGVWLRGRGGAVDVAGGAVGEGVVAGEQVCFGAVRGGVVA